MLPASQCPIPKIVVMTHHSTLEVMLCAHEPIVIGLKTCSWFRLLLKCEHVHTIKELRWFAHGRTLLHKTCAVITGDRLDLYRGDYEAWGMW